MKFLYEYRTKDNAVHRGVVCASSRDAAFAALKSHGIKPSRLADAPGFFNRLFGRGKRWLAIAALAVAFLVAFAAKLGSDRQAARSMHEAHSAMDVFDSPTRRQPIGDAAVIEKGIATGWADVFSAEGDRFLASFAIPGFAPAVRSTTEAELRRVLFPDPSSPSPASSFPIPTSRATTSPSSSLEARQILAIVKGMKDEIRALLASGWSCREVGAALVKRQERELGYYQMAEREVAEASKRNLSEPDLLDLWEQKNDELRNLGIRPIPMPGRDD